MERKRKIEAEKKRQAEEARKQKEIEARRAEERQLLQQQMAEEQARMDGIRQGAMDAEMARYEQLIMQKVKRNWVEPSGWRFGTKCDVNIRLVPGVGGGQVISAAVVRTCGQPLFDRSVEAAVNRASPLPLPTDAVLWDRFREITFEFSTLEE